jgi:hypothetical protein
MKWNQWMMLAPLPIWIAWGSSVRLYPERALDMFPYFWFLSDVGIILFFVGLMMWIAHYGEPEAAVQETPRDADEGTNGHRPSH